MHCRIGPVIWVLVTVGWVVVDGKPNLTFAGCLELSSTPGSYRLAQALYAVESVNADPGLLPDYNLRIDWYCVKGCDADNATTGYPNVPPRPYFALHRLGGVGEETGSFAKGVHTISKCVPA